MFSVRGTRPGGVDDFLERLSRWAARAIVTACRPSEVALELGEQATGSLPTTCWKGSAAPTTATGTGS